MKITFLLALTAKLFGISSASHTFDVCGSLSTESPKENVDKEAQTEDFNEIDNIFDEGCNAGELCSTRDFFEHYQCSDILSKIRPIHNESTWISLRDAYIATVGTQNSTLGNNLGFKVPIEAKHTSYAGRGLFAKEDIAEGQVVWTGWKSNNARFKTAGAFRRFLSALNNDLVCDLLIWCYPFYEDDDDETSLTIACDLDEASFTNDENKYDPEFPEKKYNVKNLGCDESNVDIEDECQFTLYALHDIKTGEELIASYAEFSEDGLWTKFGLNDVWFDGHNGVSYG